MILDKLLQLADAQAVTATAATESYIDTLAAGQSIKEQLEVLLEVDTTTDSAGDAAVMDFVIQTDTVANFASPTTIATLPQKAQAALVEGAQFKLQLPKEGVQRYIRGYFTVSTANFTAGAFSVNLVKETDIETVG